MRVPRGGSGLYQWVVAPQGEPEGACAGDQSGWRAGPLGGHALGTPESHAEGGPRRDSPAGALRKDWTGRQSVPAPGPGVARGAGGRDSLHLCVRLLAPGTRSEDGPDSALGCPTNTAVQKMHRCRPGEPRPLPTSIPSVVQVSGLRDVVPMASSLSAAAVREAPPGPEAFPRACLPRGARPLLGETGQMALTATPRSRGDGRVSQLP